RGRMFFGDGAAQGEQAADVVDVMVREDDVGDLAPIDAEFARVVQDGVGAMAGVEEQAFAVHLDEGGVTPFADAAIGEVGGEHGDAQGSHLRGVRRDGGGEVSGSGGKTDGA